MAKTYQDFMNAYAGRTIDYDGVYGAQCVDAFKVFCAWAGIPVKPCPDGWAQSYWTSRDSLGYAQYFDYISPGNVQPGDWCVWLKGSSCPQSHIAMFVGNGRFFSENQGGTRGFTTVTIRMDFAGALRWKGFPKQSASAYKSVDEMAMAIIRGTGEWYKCYGNARKIKVEKYGFNYATVQGRVNQLLGQTNTNTSDIKVGSTVTVINPITYTGQRFALWFKTYTVMELIGDRAVIGVNGVVTAAINIKNLRRA